MKRFLSLLLCALLLCLTACTPAPDAPTTDTYPPVPPASLPRLTDWENIEDDTHSLNWLYHMASYMDGEAVTLTRQHTDGSTSQATVSYDGTHYVITDSTGTRSYSHLLRAPANGSAEASFDYAEYFLLSNDPGMTAAALAADPTADAEVVYAQYLSFDRATCYGNVPPEIQKIVSKGLWITQTDYLGQSFAVNRYYITHHSSQTPIHLLERYDYAGNLLSQIPLHGLAYNALELTDGGLVFSTDAYQGENGQLLCYDIGGKLRWKYDFRHIDDNLYTQILFQRGDCIYLFGMISPNGDNDIYVGCFSLDGELLREQVFAGSDFESLYRVVLTDEGFRISGRTQSGDGPFPLSKNGYGVDFTAELSLDLVLSNVRKLEINYASYLGMHNGQTVYSDDPIFTPGEQDHLPEGVSPIGIFDYADGYVIVRSHRLAHYKFQNPVMSYSPSYVETIVTYYDADGHPVWQGVGSIYVG